MCAALALMAGIGFAAGPVSAAKPDFNGVWVFVGAHVAAQTPDDVFQTGEWPPGGEPKLKEPHATKLQELRKQQALAEESGKLVVDAYLQCMPNGMPAMMGSPLPMEILQTPRKLVVIAEELNQVRHIYLNERPPALEDIVPSYNGYSVGHWEGDTLVVVTRGVREDVLWNDIPHTPARTVTERFRLKAPAQLENRVTIDDPAILIQPHSYTIVYNRDRAHRLDEYVCDNNRYEMGHDNEYYLRFDPSP